MDQDFCQVAVGAVSAADLLCQGIERLLITDPEGDVPGGVVCPSVEGVHGFRGRRLLRRGRFSPLA